MPGIKVDTRKLKAFMFENDHDYRSLSFVTGISIGQLHGILAGNVGPGSSTIAGLLKLNIPGLFLLEDSTHKLRTLEIIVGPKIQGV